MKTKLKQKLSQKLEQAHSLALAVGDDYSDLVREAAALEAELENSGTAGSGNVFADIGFTSDDYVKALERINALEAQAERDAARIAMHQKQYQQLVASQMEAGKHYATLEADLERTCSEAGAHALYIKELSAEKAALEAQIERLQSGTEIESDHMTELDVQHLKALARIYELETENEFLKKEVRREWLSGYEECGQETDAKVSALEAQLDQVRAIVTNRDWYALGGAKDKDMLAAIAKIVGK